MKAKSIVYSVALLAGIMSYSVHAEQNEVSIKINDIRVEDTVYTPYYEVRTEQDHQQGSAQRWIRLGVYFTTDGGWLDQIDVLQMAYIERGDGQRNVKLSESVQYINIEPGDHYVYVYLHPSYVERFKIDAADLDSAAVIRVDGKIVAQKESSKHTEAGWGSKINGAIVKGYLLNHAETPFWFVNYDFKEIIKRTQSPTE